MISVFSKLFLCIIPILNTTKKENIPITYSLLKSISYRFSVKWVMKGSDRSAFDYFRGLIK